MNYPQSTTELLVIVPFLTCKIATLHGKDGAHSYLVVLLRLLGVPFLLILIVFSVDTQPQWIPPLFVIIRLDSFLKGLAP